MAYRRPFYCRCRWRRARRVAVRPALRESVARFRAWTAWRASLATGKVYEIMVTDNGSGIDAALLPYVFDLFIQAERTPDRAQGGLGLGLALVKRITALHDGSVHALSDGLGQGSSVMILLPLMEAGSQVAASA